MNFFNNISGPVSPTGEEVISAPNTESQEIVRKNKSPIHRAITTRALRMAKLNKGVFQDNVLLGNTVVSDLFGASEDFHFDGRKNFERIFSTLQSLYTQLISLKAEANNGNMNAVKLGILLHSVQDFYAHSNYVELFRKYMNDQGHGAPGTMEIPTILEAIVNPVYKDFLDNYLKKELLTGEFHLSRWLKGNDIEKTNEEGNVHHNQLAKDSPDKLGHDDAVKVATRHTASILLIIGGSSGGNSNSNKSDEGQKSKWKCRDNNGNVVDCF